MFTASGLVLLVLLTQPVGAGPDRSAQDRMPRVRLSDARDGFVLEGAGKPFVAWGFNYDHDDAGRLLEDYWEAEWDTVAADFREMKQLGANVVRVHLQFGRFMRGPNEPDAAALQRLDRLLQLAQRTGLYLDLTGLGCYHKKDVPAWYDRLDEQTRWNTQAAFWDAVAGRCAESPVIFCYDLMNEPVVPGADSKREDWLGPAFAGKHFVQFITLDRAGRPRPEIARAWIERLTAAIRRKDPQGLITIGLVPWSLDRPGLTSGFVPEKIADRLDFLCVHLYPQTGKLDEAKDTLRGFSVGKPLVVEEIFPLKCSPAEFERFLHDSRGLARGWIGFYWGKTPDECRKSSRLSDLIMLRWLETFQRESPGKRQ